MTLVASLVPKERYISIFLKKTFPCFSATVFILPYFCSTICINWFQTSLVLSQHSLLRNNMDSRDHITLFLFLPIFNSEQTEQAHQTAMCI